MTPNLQGMAGSMGLAPYTALVLEPQLAEALLIISVLSTLGFHVTVADTFKDAKHLLTLQPPALLVTELRLAEYNGLHLILRATSMRPDMATLVTSTIADPVLQREAERMGATYVQTPTTAGEFRAAVLRTIGRQPEGPPVQSPFERRTADRRMVAIGTLADQESDDRRRGERRRSVLSVLRHPDGAIGGHV